MKRTTPYFRSLSSIFLVLANFGFSSTMQAQIAASKPLVLFDFEKNIDVKSVTPIDATYEAIKTEKSQVLKVESGVLLNESGVKLFRTTNNNWNLNGYYQVKADVSNLGDKEIQVEMFVGNDPDGLVRWYCSDYVDLLPNESKTITVSLSWTPWVFSPQLEVEGMRGTPGKIKTNINNIDQISFNTRYATSPSVFTIDNVRAEGKLEVRDTTGFFPFIDIYGQYAHDNWLHKIHSDDDFRVLKEKELADIAQNPGPTDRSKYGGWTAGPKLKSTGFFRTEKYKGKWWMVDPEGYLFWTAGLNCVASDNANTGVQYRESYFANLPDKKSSYGQFYGVSNWASHGFYRDHIPYDTYNFYQSNLYRKYGENWHDAFKDAVHTRLKSWGLNTIGFVSDFGAALQHKTPYVGSIWIRNTPKIIGSDGFWGKFHDVFDPKFREAVRSSMNQQKTGAGDSWCIGFFVDNEMSWGRIGSLAVGTLISPPTQAAKIEFVKDLKMKYQKIDKLNLQWKSTYKSWDDLLQSTTPPDEAAAELDLSVFYSKIAQTYFRIIKEELNQIAPNQNYLGCRFAWANNDLTLKAAAQYCDIVSFNKYEYSVENVSLPKGVDKPIMIGEFHFGSLDRGMCHVGVKEAYNQQDRGDKYKAYIQGALQNEQIVGAHWFQYLDEAYTGRGDGENYNVGFVNVSDAPYFELINRVRETCYDMYNYRSTH